MSRARVRPLPILAERLEDARGRRVVFLAHCLLNENTRYAGGACQRGCVRGVVDRCIEDGIGMVQLPCPEELAWGGVWKRRLLALYGLARRKPLLARMARATLPLLIAYTRAVYRRLARRVVAQIVDYRTSHFDVVGVVGIDGSPTCGVGRTLDLTAALDEALHVDTRSFTRDEQNDLVRRSVRDGQGLFVAALRDLLARRGVSVSFLAHDLLRELDGAEPTDVVMPAGRGRSWHDE